jgi:hypothetical protein
MKHKMLLAAALCGALTFAVAVVALRGNVAYAQEVHDHFKSYSVSGHLLPSPIDVTLTDQFGTVQGSVQYISLFSPPTEKLLPGGGISSIIHDENHLTWYNFEGTADARTLLVTNQFGDGQEWVVKDPKFLLLPAWKLYVNGLPTGLGHPLGLDHYLCYEAISGPPVDLDGVTLTDQFHQEYVTVGAPKLLCNPADKIVPDDGNPIFDSGNHLACYDITPQLLPPPLEVWANDQFGDSMFMVLENRYLCVPSLKSTPSSTTTTSTTTSTTSTTTMLPPLDHYKCYKVKDLKNPKFEKTKDPGISLNDQFGDESDIDVIKPFFICNPADKDSSGISNEDAHLCCYKIKAQKLASRPQVEIEDQFGTLQLEAIKPQILCQPCSKTVLP